MQGHAQEFWFALLVTLSLLSRLLSFIKGKLRTYATVSTGKHSRSLGDRRIFPCEETDTPNRAWRR